MPGHYGKGMKKGNGAKKKTMNKGMSKLPKAVQKKILGKKSENQKQKNQFSKRTKTMP